MRGSGVKPYGNYRKLYATIRQHDSWHAAVRSTRELAEIDAIWATYERFSTAELRLIRAAIKKTEAQLGYVPFCMTTVPLVFLIFSSKLAGVTDSLAILAFIMVLLALSAIWFIHRHFTLKAYNALHAHIVDALLELKSASATPPKEPPPAEPEPEPSPPMTSSAAST